MWVLILIAIGIGALWGMSRVGGIGGESGHSKWWGVLVLPYLIGWSMGVWGPGMPRWVPMVGIVVGLWYLVIPVLVLVQSKSNPSRPVFPAVLICLGLFGLLTIAGCIYRLRNRTPERNQETSLR